MNDRAINGLIMQNTLASIWRPVRGVCIQEIQPNLFLFQFYHELDIKRVIDNGPWTFNNHMLIINRLKPRDQPRRINLFHADFLVQLHGLPVDFMSKFIGKHVGNYIDSFFMVDPKSFEGGWKNFIRIKVNIDVRNALQCRMKSRKEGGD